MRAIMARLRGPRLTPGERVDAALARCCSLEDCPDTRPHYHRGDDELVRLPDHREAFFPGPGRVATQISYRDALLEADEMCRNLGLDVGPGSEAGALDVGGLVRYVYGQGWHACESRLAAPNMADAIDLAITTPAAVVERNAGQSERQWTIRAIQHAVAHGVTSEREAAG